MRMYCNREEVVPMTRCCEERKARMKEKEEKKTTTNVLFQKTVCNVPWNVRTQEVDKAVSSWEAIEDYLWEMFDDENEFVTLTTADARYNIRYVQATQADGEIVVQLGIEEGENTKLVEKMCTEEECLNIFQEFYTSVYVQDWETYTPVEFYV